MTKQMIAQHHRFPPPALCIAGAAAGDAILVRQAARLAENEHPLEAVVDAIDYISGRAALAWGSGSARVSSTASWRQ